jgi:hypothetical protein
MAALADYSIYIRVLPPPISSIVTRAVVIGSMGFRHLRRGRPYRRDALERPFSIASSSVKR